MRLGLNLGYWGAGNDANNLVLAREADRLGYSVVWAAEAYGSDAATVLAWVEAPHDVRMARGLARDGAAFAPHWERWATGEAEHFVRHDTRSRADVCLDTTPPGAQRRLG